VPPGVPPSLDKLDDAGRNRPPLHFARKLPDSTTPLVVGFDAMARSMSLAAPASVRLTSSRLCDW
jgi:hypothetical protein